jgi:hypothetical protein
MRVNKMFAPPQNGKLPYRYGGQVNKNKDGDRHIDMEVKLSLKYNR